LLITYLYIMLFIMKSIFSAIACSICLFQLTGTNYNDSYGDSYGDSVVEVAVVVVEAFSLSYPISRRRRSGGGGGKLSTGFVLNNIADNDANDVPHIPANDIAPSPPPPLHEEWSDERKSELFQFLLRDLEVEGTPLLGCEGVSENKTLQGATWSVAGQLSENDYERKVCLVFEDIPIQDLQLFVDTFSTMKQKQRRTHQQLENPLQDLQRFSMSLVGNGIGPALIVETQNRTTNEIETYHTMQEHDNETSSMLLSNPIMEHQWKTAMELFITRCLPELLLENENEDVDEDENASSSSSSSSISYRFLGSSDVCDILSGYWNCICELETTDITKANSIVLSYPPPPPSSSDTTATALARFAALSELLTTMNSLYEGQYQYRLHHIHPSYNRDEMNMMLSNNNNEEEQHHNINTNGHLFPTHILREKLQKIVEQDMYTTDTELIFTDEELQLQNYQRRSPLPGVIIQRIIVLKEDDDDEKDAYCEIENVIRIMKDGEEENNKALINERNALLLAGTK